MSPFEKFAARFTAVAARRDGEHLRNRREGRICLECQLRSAGEERDERAEETDPAVYRGTGTRGTIGIVKHRTTFEPGGGLIGGGLVQEVTLTGLDDIAADVPLVGQGEDGEQGGASIAALAGYTQNKRYDSHDLFRCHEPEPAPTELVLAQRIRDPANRAAPREESNGISGYLRFIGLDCGVHGGSLPPGFGSRRFELARTPVGSGFLIPLAAGRLRQTGSTREIKRQTGSRTNGGIRQDKDLSILGRGSGIR